MLRKKSNKKLKKMMALMRRRRVQLIQQVIRTHQKVTLNTVKSSMVSKKKPSTNGARLRAKKKVTKIKGRIATSRRKSRDLWRGKI